MPEREIAMAETITEQLGPRLTDAFSAEEITALKAEMVPSSVASPVRFLHDGRNLNIQSGRLMQRGTNVIYQTVYWNFTRATAEKIASALHVKAVFSE